MDITAGHWIFAALFLVVFIGVIAWSFRKDRTINKKQFGNTSFVALLIGGGVLLIIILKFALRYLSSH
jgi:cbb3-type cytochrome oxidase subunit 3